MMERLEHGRRTTMVMRNIKNIMRIRTYNAVVEGLDGAVGVGNFEVCSAPEASEILRRLDDSVDRLVATCSTSIATWSSDRFAGRFHST